MPPDRLVITGREAIQARAGQLVLPEMRVARAQVVAPALKGIPALRAHKAHKAQLVMRAQLGVKVHVVIKAQPGRPVIKAHPGLGQISDLKKISQKLLIINV